MARIRFAAFDVDGTLVDSRLNMTEPVRAALRRLLDAGVEVAIATGRALSELGELRALFPEIRYFIFSHGAAALNTKSGNTLYSRLLPLPLAREIARAASETPCMIEVYADGVSYVQADRWARMEDYHAAFLRHPTLFSARVPAPDILRFLDERTVDVEKLDISFAHSEDCARIQALCAGLPVSLNVSIYGELEINRLGTNKGDALLAVLRAHGVLPAEAAALGDGIADIPMFRLCGLPIAMGNAPESVRAAARFVAPDCDADGAAWAIERMLLSGV